MAPELSCTSNQYGVEETILDHHKTIDNRRRRSVSCLRGSKSKVCRHDLSPQSWENGKLADSSSQHLHAGALTIIAQQARRLLGIK